MAEFTKEGLLKRINQSILEECENKNGHTIFKHVGVETEKLQKRCLTEKVKVSSFYKKDAEILIMQTLTDEHYKGGNINYILDWINDPYWDDPYVVEMEFPTTTGYGYQYNRKTREADYIKCNGVNIVLRKLDRYEFLPFAIVTAYPCIIK